MYRSDFLSVFVKCVDALRPNQHISVMSGRFPVFLGWTITKQQIKRHTERHNTETLVRNMN